MQHSKAWSKSTIDNYLLIALMYGPPDPDWVRKKLHKGGDFIVSHEFTRVVDPILGKFPHRAFIWEIAWDYTVWYLEQERINEADKRPG